MADEQIATEGLNTGTKEDTASKAEQESGTQAGTLEELLKTKEGQSAFDRRVQQALKTAREKWQEEKETAIKDAVTEAQKLAKMTADERAKHEQAQELEKIAKREADVTRRELMATAREQLGNDGLPQSLADCLVYTDADACAKSMEAVKKAFGDAVQAAVNDRLRQTPPKMGEDNTSDPTAKYRRAAGLK